MPHSTKNARVVVLDPHASAAAKALLSSPELAINVRLGDSDASGQTRDVGNKRLAV
jgi:hypothetical protein